MTTIDETPILQRKVCIPFSKGNVYVPQQLIEANELLNSVNRRLEDCALEWQAEISRKQWKIFNSNTIGENLPEKSLLSRTYFSEKSLDETFQHLLSSNKVFSEYLKNFIALLQGEKPVINVKETCDAQNQCSNIENGNMINNFNTESMHFSSLKNQHLNETRKTQNLVDNILMAQNLFADVIKAKVNFDTKFLGFEAVLHKTTSIPTDTACLCQYCSKIMTTTDGGHKKLRNITVNQKNRTITKAKRLTRSMRSLSKKREIEKASLPIGDNSDQPSFGTNTSFC